MSTQQLATRMAAKLGHIEPFNVQTDNWSLYTERLSQYFIANDITQDRSLMRSIRVTHAVNMLHSNHHCSLIILLHYFTLLLK